MVGLRFDVWLGIVFVWVFICGACVGFALLLYVWFTLLWLYGYLVIKCINSVGIDSVIWVKCLVLLCS